MSTAGGRAGVRCNPVNYEQDGTVVVGRVRGIFGVKGWVRVQDYSSRIGDILQYDTWLLKQDQGWVVRTVLEGRLHQKGVVCHLKGYDDPAQAKELMDVDIAVAADGFGELEPGEYYWHQLEGLEVVNLSGENLGKVDRLLETGANDVLVLKGEQERLVPYTPGVVAEIDLDRGRIQVDWEKDY